MGRRCWAESFLWLPGQCQQAREHVLLWLCLEMLLLHFGKVVGPLPDPGTAGPPLWGSRRRGQHL